jgi:translation initiation factor RLI1
LNKKDIAAAWSLIERIRKHDRVGLIVPVGMGVVDVVQDALHVTFPKSYRVFLQTFGAVFIWNEYLSGITDSEKPLEVVRGNVYWDTIQTREEIGLPEHMVVVQVCDDEFYQCLDTSQMKRGECPVLGIDRPPMRGRSVLAKNFTEHFLNFLEGHLEE